MAHSKSDVLSDRHNFNLNVFNLAVFILVALTGSLLQIQYHMHGLPDSWPVLGLSKAGWVVLHKASAPLFLAGIAAHCWLKRRFVTTLTWRIVHRQLSALSSLSYDLFLICLPTCVTALASWILLGAGNPGRWVLIEIHDKLGWLLILFAVLHVLMRAGRMTRVYRKLYRERVAG